jgi:putative membrane protein
MSTELPFGELRGLKVLDDRESQPADSLTLDPAQADVGSPSALSVNSLTGMAAFGSASSSFARAIAYLGLAGLGTVITVYLLYRCNAFFEACSRAHPLLGFLYLAGLGVTVLSVGYFAMRAARRYARLNEVETARRRSARVRQGLAGEAEERLLQQWIVSRVQSAQRGPLAEVSERANRLTTQLALHSSAERAIREFEEYLLLPLDCLADQIIERRAAQAALGTAVASGLFDPIIVSAQAVRLVDEISQLYAGRPGWLGTMRLLRRAIGITLFAEIAEQATELLAETTANKAAAKIGGRVGQGLANGLLVGRLGHAVKQQCRPIDQPRTRLTATQLVGSLLAATPH